MITAFWSPIGKHVGVTTNLACIACFYALRFHRRITVFENHLPNEAGLEQVLVPGHGLPYAAVHEEPYYYESRGIEQLIRILRAGYNPSIMDRVATPLLDGLLQYLPLSEQMNAEVYEYELNLVIEQLLGDLSEKSDMVLVDTQSQGNLTTKVILDCADVVVINLRQEPEEAEQIWRQCVDLREKAVFLLSHYKEEKGFGPEELASLYGIPKERIWIMPEYPMLSYLGEQGRIPDFMVKQLWTTRGEKNFTLIREIRRAAGVLYEMEKERVSI